MQCQKLNTYMETGRVVFLPAKNIRPNPAQPRRIFQQEALDELAGSILRHGILQPLSVRRVATGYELIAGERRLRAARQAGLSEIPCIIMTMDEKESGMAAMIENLHRRDLDFIEEAQGICALMEKWGTSQEQTAKLLGKSQSAIANKLRLLRHSDQVLDRIRECALTERHARALLKISSEEEKLQLIDAIWRGHMSVAQTEQLIERHLAGKRSRSPRPNINRFINDLTQSLAKIQLSGIQAISERRETESEIVLTITIPK
ncbi:MAG: ParB/RepB/Spo0J family partition protein [Ruminococcaceae bacterium]|nr:ParB/RepB/Spo0J family partition protein [Oscillospiraceae bacterium]MBQ3214883.1 ParB/RepB/Spo0J family partition protein [Oscillospiraceae bacterium]